LRFDSQDAFPCRIPVGNFRQPVFCYVATGLASSTKTWFARFQNHSGMFIDESPSLHVTDQEQHAAATPGYYRWVYSLVGHQRPGGPAVGTAT